MLRGMRLALLTTLAASLLAIAPAAQAACKVTVHPGLPPHHVDDLNAKAKTNSFPPTSGTHYSSPARFDIYTFALPQLAVVHNLEHGGVAVQYGKNVPKEDVARLRAWYLKDSSGLVVAPLPALGSTIALGAWNAPPYKNGVAPEKQDPGHGYLATCTGFDAAAFTRFVRQHRYKGGERFPPALLKRNPR
jgi:hypothetical protein